MRRSFDRHTLNQRTDRNNWGPRALQCMAYPRNGEDRSNAHQRIARRQDTGTGTADSFENTRSRPGPSGPAIGNPLNLPPRPPPNPLPPERQPAAGRGLNVGTHRIIRHRQQALANTEPPPDIVGDCAQRSSPP